MSAKANKEVQVGELYINSHDAIAVVIGISNLDMKSRDPEVIYALQDGSIRNEDELDFLDHWDIFQDCPSVQFAASMMEQVLAQVGQLHEVDFDETRLSVYQEDTPTEEAPAMEVNPEDEVASDDPADVLSLDFPSPVEAEAIAETPAMETNDEEPTTQTFQVGVPFTTLQVSQIAHPSGELKVEAIYSETDQSGTTRYEAILVGITVDEAQKCFETNPLLKLPSGTQVQYNKVGKITPSLGTSGETVTVTLWDIPAAQLVTAFAAVAAEAQS